MWQVHRSLATLLTQYLSHALNAFPFSTGKLLSIYKPAPILPESAAPSPAGCIVLHLVLCANKNQLHSNGRFWFICNIYASLALKSNINTKY